MTTHEGETLTRILEKRCGEWTLVELEDGRQLRVLNVARGRDIGDDFDHYTTNISPNPVGSDAFDFFFAHQVTRLIDEYTGGVLFEPKSGVQADVKPRHDRS